MGDSIELVNSEVVAVAERFETLGMEYGCPLFGSTGTDAVSTGHVELSDQLPAFCDVVTDVLNALTGNLAAIAEALRESSELICRADDDAFDVIATITLATFNPHTDLG